MVKIKALDKDGKDYIEISREGDIIIIRATITSDKEFDGDGIIKLPMKKVVESMETLSNIFINNILLINIGIRESMILVPYPRIHGTHAVHVSTTELTKAFESVLKK